ncbi:cytochrome c oxidase accessory protein CcoG [Yunchengibacter salinarum]|uniref:cytochrome c oxidase accessory protein CcoG n=1 Tax=Yunchengibacter salinarum TaxID=3133399 RepID=UPI0035B5A2AA
MTEAEADTRKSPAGTSAGGQVLGTPGAEPVNRKETRLYAGRKKVYPRRVYGRFRLIKWVVMAVSLGIYYVTPWLRWERPGSAPDQAVLIDFPTRKAYVFGLEIWAQEVYLATGLLIMAAFALFLITALAGRVWCGYMCPQTVWTDLFVHIERWIQGDRNKRIKLDKAPWGPEKVIKKAVTHLAFLLVAMGTGGAFVFYFGNAPDLAVQLVSGTAPLTSYFFVGLLTFTTYLLGGIAREQVCIYMCPWPRIQGALVDEHSFLVSYDRQRGEPRGKHKKGESWEGRGDCIDCQQCVAVCPTGIDIRDGFQLECIQCALCVDACNSIMDKVGRPPNLIQYAATHVDQAGGKKLQETKVIRPRVVLYAAMLALVAGLMLASVVTRSDISMNIMKDRNPLFVTLSNGEIRNDYTVNIMNRLHDSRPVTVTVDGLPDLAVKTAFGAPGEAVRTTVPPDDMRALSLFVIMPGEHVRAGVLDAGKGRVTIRVKDDAGTVLLSESVAFHGPER